MPSSHAPVYARSMEDPEGFWARAAEDLYWEKRWDRVLDDSRAPFYSWFAGGVLNTCYNALDFHVERGRGRQVALIYDSPVTGTVRKLTYERAAGRGRPLRRRAPANRRREGRPGDPLHADGPGGGRRDARLRPASGPSTPSSSAVSRRRSSRPGSTTRSRR